MTLAERDEQLSLISQSRCYHCGVGTLRLLILLGLRFLRCDHCGERWCID